MRGLCSVEVLKLMEGKAHKRALESEPLVASGRESLSGFKCVGGRKGKIKKQVLERKRKGQRGCVGLVLE